MHGRRAQRLPIDGKRTLRARPEASYVSPDRDIVVKCLAAGKDPSSTTAGELAQGSTYHVAADADIEEMLDVMEEHQVRRLPVIENHRLVGIVSEAYIARHLPEHAIVQFVKAICSPKALTSH